MCSFRDHRRSDDQFGGKCVLCFNGSRTNHSRATASETNRRQVVAGHGIARGQCVERAVELWLIAERQSSAVGPAVKPSYLAKSQCRPRLLQRLVRPENLECPRFPPAYFESPRFPFPAKIISARPLTAEPRAAEQILTRRRRATEPPSSPADPRREVGNDHDDVRGILRLDSLPYGEEFVIRDHDAAA